MDALAKIQGNVFNRKKVKIARILLGFGYTTFNFMKTVKKPIFSKEKLLDQ